MPIGANRYYSDPTIGRIGSNLATAIYGSPEDRLKRGLYDAQAENYGAETEKNRAEAGLYGAQAGKANAETTGITNKNTARSKLGEAFSRLSLPLDGEDLNTTLQRNSQAVGDIMAGFDNPDEGAKAVTEYYSRMLSQGSPNQQRQALIMHGQMPGINFSPTGDVADANATRNSRLKTNEDVAKERVTNEGAADRNVYTQGQENHRNDVNEAGRNQRFYDTPINLPANSTAVLSPTDPRRPKLGDRLYGRTDTSDSKPSVVSSNDLEDAIASAAQQIPGATIPTKDGKFVINPEFETSFPPQKVMQARTEAANIYQTTRNAQSAVTAYMRVLGIQPGATFKGAHSTTLTGRLFGDTAKPAGIVQPAGDPISDARNAIAKGAPRAAVIQRLQQAKIPVPPDL